MATITVATCPGASAGIETTASGNDVAVCATGQLSYQNVVIAEPFDPSTLNSEELGGAFGAGFVVMGIGLCITWGAKHLLRTVRAARF